MPRHHLADTLNQIARDLHQQGTIHRLTQDETLFGRTFTTDGREVVNFSSCSYLGLERHPALLQGCRQALDAYGTQFSSSRAYISLGLYEELESLLGDVFGQPAIVTASTTLGHCSALPALVRSNDAVILDHQVHASVHMAAQLLKASGVRLQLVRHSNVEHLEKLVKSLKAKHEKIWYLADGVYSMYGDFAPLADLKRLMDRHEQLWLYIDDAHGMSWTGERGCGYVRSQIPHWPRMVQAVSLNKAFACAGGALLFPDDSTRAYVRNAGQTLIFGGPIQPPMLGAAVASARLHLSEEFPAIQNGLRTLLRYTNERMKGLGLPQVDTNESPIFFVPLGLPKLANSLAGKLLADGYYVNNASFPAVPLHKGGVRFVVHRSLERGDIDGMLIRMATHYDDVLREHESSSARVASAFRIPPFEVRALNEGPATSVTRPVHRELSVERHDSIQAYSPPDWDEYLGASGMCHHSNLQMLERVFGARVPGPEAWKFSYFTVRDSDQTVVIRAFTTVARVKDDMFSPASTSRRVEEMREGEPDFLTSNAVLLGCPFTKGKQLYVNRQHHSWKDALRLLVEEMRTLAGDHEASRILLRDFSPDDRELEDALLDIGLVALPLLDNCVVSDFGWNTREEYLGGLGQRYRYNVRREILRREGLFRVDSRGPESDADIEQCYALYEQVHARAYELNVHKLPVELFRRMAASDEYDVLRLYFSPDADEALVPGGAERDAPIAVMFSLRHRGKYQALLVGLDYRYVLEFGTYKQILFKTLERAKELGDRELDLAYTAVLEKKKLGARPHPTRGFIQLFDHYNTALLEALGE